MNYFLGIDLGTSSVKVTVTDETRVVNSAKKDYTLLTPKEGYSDQDVNAWLEKTLEAVKEALSGIDKTLVRAISFSGQMHGLVMLDKNDNPLRPAILWNDSRSGREVAYLNNEIGKDFLIAHTGNIAFAGFTAPKLLWVKKNEPEIFDKTEKIMLPKDFLAYKFSGTFATDTSDASGTLYFDVKKRTWSDEMLEILGISEEKLPKVYESYETVGTLLPRYADLLGLPHDVKVVIGAGDNAASAVGMGVVREGECNISLGTSGTVFVAHGDAHSVADGAIHTFCDANGSYHYLACILSAASAQKWWIEDILRTDYGDMSACEKYLGENEVFFLPYLTGERSPINDERASAVFFGINSTTSREKMTLALLEGVAFALRQNIELIKASGCEIKSSKICGGGTKNRLWLKIIANALNIPLDISKSSEGGSVGAALLAARGYFDGGKRYQNMFSVFTGGECERILPDKHIAEKYNEKYARFLRIYPTVREI